MSVKCLPVIGSSIWVSRLPSRVSLLMYQVVVGAGAMLVAASAACVPRMVSLVVVNYFDTAFCPLPRVPHAPSKWVVTSRAAGFSVIE